MLSSNWSNLNHHALDSATWERNIEETLIMLYFVPIWQGTIQFVTIGHDKTFAKTAFWQDSDWFAYQT